ncbi:MAG TPA: cbb3-type cytochrome c oxidase subunit I [Verrucomicrobiales bacterium]|jgi:cytochrome c oxidase cbb3-type subunit 1|nr:cbb3-type cytochrome c oxidase subunit I [Verrucomicrobiales bacterium]
MTVPQPTPEDLTERAAIDRSARYPVMFFFTSAAAWLLFATVMGFVSSVKLRMPGLWDDCPFMSYGRLFPVHFNALVYGWAMQAGMGVMLWMMARLTRSRIQYPILLIVMGHVWNAAVATALFCIWVGTSRSIPLLDFPAWIWPVFAISYALIVVWVVPMFQSRRNTLFYVSEMYLIGAALWFPWIFVTVNLLINRGTAPVMGAGADAWYISNLIYFWMAPVALAVAYYIVPKISGRAIFSYPLAQISFWLLAILAGWTGFSRYMGGPFAAWMPAVSGAAAIFILLAIVTTVANLLLTLKGCSKLWQFSPSLRFTVFGMLMLAAYAVLSAISSTFYFGQNLQFSHFLVGLDTLAFYGFFSMTMFGAFYFIVPRITGSEWPSGERIRTHFWFSTYGIATMIVTMLVGGVAQGGNLAQWDQTFSISFINSSAYVVGRAVAWALISFSNVLFLYQLVLMFIGKGRKSQGPTLIHSAPGEAPSARVAAGL